MPPQILMAPAAVCSFDSEAVQRLTKEGETILIFDRKVYNVTKFLKYHPGGDHLIKAVAGTDVTEIMRAMHHNSILVTKLPRYCIGEFYEDIGLMEPIKRARIEKKVRLSEAYHNLEKTLIADGIYEPNHRFYIRELIKCMCLFITSLYLAFFGPRHLLNFCTSALLMSLYWHQSALFFHDLAHRYVTFDAKFDYIVAVILSNLFSGTCVGWWKHNHNIHHIVTNDPECDPDIQHMPFLAYSTKFFSSLYSKYYGHEMTFDLPSRFLVSIQHYLFYVIMMFARFNLYALGIRHLLSRPCPMKRLEVACVSSFFIWFSLMLSTFPDWKCRIAFVVFTHFPQAILHLQLVMSHSFMPIESVEEDDLFVLRQLRTSIDIDCPEWLDWFHGGLNFQVLHHLFPRVPRPHFRRLLVHVKRFCEEQGLERHSVDFTNGNYRLIGCLKDVADQVSLLINVAKNAKAH
ncbi:hypothetical protein DSO57_1020113 [Entomophthora muscae]|uniref:Uncharacterized protein n=1 Tax=Entomophthora muscae TaxID=34485 RepID=A0ACC2SSM4_9FUNG|nr:hypothetical protein DSO57_1020113 [Entomophthora muscae]